MVYPMVQATTTLFTSADPTMPEPCVTVHTWSVGCLLIDTKYPAPLRTVALKAKLMVLPVPMSVVGLRPLSSRVIEWLLSRPVMVPPTVYGFGSHTTATVVTFAEVTLPDPLPTVQVSPSGCVPTVTL